LALPALSCNSILSIEEATLIDEGGQGGSAKPCTDTATCDDDNPCSEDSCVKGFCQHAVLTNLDAPADAQTEGDCQLLVCIDGEAQTQADDADLPDDGLVCTDNVCTSGTPSNPPLDAATSCTQNDGTVCDGAGKCVECVSNEQCTPPDECGGSGTPNTCGCKPTSCASVGLSCGFAADNGCGMALDCNNSMQDGAETDVDCGGDINACSQRCNDGKKCSANSDCANSVCLMKICDSGVWASSHGDGSAQQAVAVAVDGSDNLVVTGTFNGTIKFDSTLTSAGGQDVFIAKLDTFGVPLWSKSFGNAAEQSVTSLNIDNMGNILIVGHFEGEIDFGGGALSSAGGQDAYLAKLDSNGAHIWSKAYGDTAQQRALSVATDGSGNVLLAGGYAGTLTLGMSTILTSAGGEDGFLAKLNSIGAVIWAKSFGDAAEQHASVVAVDSLGNVLVAGQMDGSVDFGAGPVASAGATDLFGASYDANGTLKWASPFGDVQDQCSGTCPISLAFDLSNAIVVAAGFEGTIDLGGGPLTSAGGSDVLLAKIGSGGAHLFSTRFGDTAEQAAHGVAIDAAGAMLLCGAAAGDINFGGGVLSSNSMSTDVFVAKISSGGSYQSAALYGDASPQSCLAMARDSQNKALVGGIFEGTLDLKTSQALVSNGMRDAFIAKLAP